MEKLDPTKKETKVFYLYCIIEQEGKTYHPKILKEKMEYNGESFEINEIYGIEASDFAKKDASIN